jgi:hypothetical protein
MRCTLTQFRLPYTIEEFGQRTLVVGNRGIGGALQAAECTMLFADETGVFATLLGPDGRQSIWLFTAAGYGPVDELLEDEDDDEPDDESRPIGDPELDSGEAPSVRGQRGGGARAAAGPDSERPAPAAKPAGAKNGRPSRARGRSGAGAHEA